MQTKITINGIAKIAKVSKGTVSRVLNNERGVGDKTRERILKLIKDLDYKPSAIARSLVSLKTNNIGIVMPSDFGAGISHTFWPRILSSITQAAAELNMCVLVTSFDVEAENVEESYKRILAEHRVDGLITFADILGRRRTAELVAGRYPFVSIGREDGMRHHFVDVENREGAQVMTEHLIGLGRRNIVFICGPKTRPSVRARLSGFKDVVAKHPHVKGKVLEVPYSNHETQKMIVGFLRENPEVDALFISAANFVMDGLIACKHLNLSIPDDIAFACFDELDFFKERNLLTSPITSISQPVDELGREAVRMLHQLLQGEPKGSLQKILRTTLVVRESCGELIARRAS
jgi:DNA-binding LacI/PurR family transcriptional regulator